MVASSYRSITPVQTGDNERDLGYIIEKEGEYPTSLWYCVTTHYRVHDLYNDIHMQSVFTGFPHKQLTMRPQVYEYHYNGHASGVLRPVSEYLTIIFGQFT